MAEISWQKKIVWLGLLLAFGGWPLLAGADLDTGLVGYWNMDSADITWNPTGTSTIIDRSGNGNTGYLVNLTQATSSVAGKYGESIQFATSTYILVPNSASLDLTTNNAFTISSWIKYLTYPNQYTCIICKSGAPNVFLSSSGVTFRPEGTIDQLIGYFNSYQAANLNQWYHIVTTYDGTTEKIYVSGTTTNILPVGYQVSAGEVGRSANALYIGNDVDDTYFTFDQDDVRLYNRALSADEVNQLFTADSFDTSPIGSPAVPQNFGLVSHSTSTAVFSWTANSEADLGNYYLYENSALRAVINGSSTTYELDNLTPGTSYTFSLSAVNLKRGESATTSNVTITMDSLPSLGTVTPDQYLAAQPHPTFKTGNTLPPLTKWSWPYSFNLLKEMASWGYALDFGDADAQSISHLADPNSTESKLVQLAHDDPEHYKLSVNLGRIENSQLPPEAFTLGSTSQRTAYFSPEAPDWVLQAMAATTTYYLNQVLAKAPAAIILNGGERYLGVQGDDDSAWKDDSSVLAAKGSMSWIDYISQRKSHQEMFFTNATHAVAPKAPYIYYFTGDQNRVDNSFWYMWDWDYKNMRGVSDYPNSSSYLSQFNSGWTGGDDILSLALNAYGYDRTFGDTTSYNWVNDGFYTNPTDPRHGDLNLYEGFLKSYYVAGMLGGVAGYFAYPDGGFAAAFDSSAPPHWLLQIEALSRVHAEFSYLEDILRGGELLPGPGRSLLSVAQPEYEFPTGNLNTRVLARKLNGRKRWLISAWAADNVDRTVKVTIPTLGRVTLDARPAGSLYDARIVHGQTELTQLDAGASLSAALSVPTASPDLDAPDTAAPAITLTYPTTTPFLASSTITLTATATDNIEVDGVTFYLNNSPLGAEVATPNYAGAYTFNWDTTQAMNGDYSLVAVARDESNNFATSSAMTVTVANPTSPGGSSGSSGSSGSGGGSGGGGTAATTVVTSSAISSVSATSTELNDNPMIALLEKQIEFLKAQLLALQNLAASATTTNLWTRDLQLGSSGLDVKKLQQFLNAHGYLVAKSGPGASGKETTIFGLATKLAVMKFQTANKIKPVNGRAGPATRKALRELRVKS